MDAKLEQRLFDEFPLLYRDRESTSMHRGFECGDGWFDLIHTLSCDIETEARNAGIPMNSAAWPQCRQVKQKFGELRFVVFAHKDYQAVYDRIGQLRIAAMEESAHICEGCGRPKELDCGCPANLTQ